MDPTTVGLVISLISLVGSAGEAKTENDRKAIADKARSMMFEAEQAAKQAQKEARARGDKAGESRAGALLSELSALERRTDMRRMGDALDRAHDRYRDEAGTQAIVDTLTLFVSTGTSNRLSGANKQAWDWGDLARTVLEQQRGAANADDPRLLFDSIMRERNDLEPLPADAGSYLARETYRSILRDNPQLLGVDAGEVHTFVCNQGQKELRRRLSNTMGNRDAEVILQAQSQLCAENSFAGDVKIDGVKGLKLKEQSATVKFTRGVGEAATGTIRLAFRLNDKDLFELVDTMTSAAAAGTLGMGNDTSAAKARAKLRDELRGCFFEGVAEYVLTGTHDGEKTMKGTVKPAPSSFFKGRCQGKSYDERATKMKGGTWKAHDGGAQVDLTATVEGLELRGFLRRG